MAKTDSLTYARLRELLHYDQLTGVFTWRVARKGRWGIKPGVIAGTLTPHGYIVICVDGINYFAHRLAWFYIHRAWPPIELDHEDTVKTHNWIKNLRPATKSQNGQNQRKPPSNNTSGYLGVVWSKQKKKWMAKIKVGGKQKHLGYARTAVAAYEKYLAGKAKLHPFQTLVKP